MHSAGKLKPLLQARLQHSRAPYRPVCLGRTSPSHSQQQNVKKQNTNQQIHCKQRVLIYSLEVVQPAPPDWLVMVTNQKESHRFPLICICLSSDDVARCLTYQKLETLGSSFEYRTYKLSCSTKRALFLSEGSAVMPDPSKSAPRKKGSKSCY